VTLPDPPSNCDVETYLGITPLTAGLLAGRRAEDTDYFERFSYQQFRLQP
jgi:hypothetical protein